jgi:hypothetical protein
MHERHRQLCADVVKQTLIAVLIATAAFVAFGRWTYAEAVGAGSGAGLLSLFHIGKSFYRLTKHSRTSVAVLIVESLARVLFAGIVPVVLFRHGPLWAYFIYLAAFVAPLAVTAAWMRQEFKRDLVCPRAAD